MIKYIINVDMVPGGVRTVVPLNQYDSDFELEIHLFASQGEFTVPSGTTATIRGTKSDGNGYDQTVTVDTENKVATVTGDVQMTAAAGRSVFEISLMNNNKELNTANFDLLVERAALDKDTVASDSRLRQFADIYDDHADEIINAGAQYAAYKEEMDELEEAATAAAESTAADVATVTAAAQAFARTSEQATSDLTNAATAAIQQIDNKSAAIAALTTDAETVARQALSLATTADNEVAEMQNDISSLKSARDALTLSLAGKIDDAYVENGYLYMTSDGEVMVGPLGPFSGTGGGGGGGGTSGNTASLSVTNNTGWLSKTIAEDGSAIVSIIWSSEEDDMPTGDGTAKITVNGAVRAMLNIAQGTVSIDLAPYCSAGSNVVKVTVSDIYDNSRTINFTITIVAISLSSTFDASTPYRGAISFPYTPVGEVSKTVRFLLDGVLIGTASTSVSGRQMSFTIPQQTHGAHTLECYFECTLNGQTVESNRLHYEIICLETLNTTPIVASSFNASTAVQYATLNVPYSVYDPSSLTAEVTIRVNGNLVSTQTVDRTEQTFAYRANTAGTLTIVIASGTASKTITLTVTESNINAMAETESLVLHLDSVGRSNNEANPGTWRDADNNITATMTDFNFASDGWQLDEDGITVLRVSGDARVNIPYQLFGSDFRTTGKTIEVEFATRDVMNYDAVILSCLSGGRGLSMTAQKATLTSQQSEIFMQYKEGEHVRLAFVVEKRSENRLVYVYVNGIMSGVVQYPTTDDFAQASPVGISIGSNNCTIDLYCIRVYDNDLTRYQVLENWIADSQDVDDLLARYNRNQVYDAYGNVIISNLPGSLPYMIIECEELPQYKGDKKTVNVTYVDPVTPSKSFTATGVQIDVQGTSSQYYARKNYKLKYKNGFDLTQSGTHAALYALRPGAIATSAFCMKADVASSEGANNVELARLYNDTCVYQTPPQEENAAIRQGIDGFPCVIFWSDGVNTVFLGKYNFNNDKGTEDVFGFETGDESWEIKNNTSDRVLWKSADFSNNDWLNDFEARYPDTDPAYTDSTQLAAFAAWLVSTDQAQATGDALAESYTDVDGTVHTVDNAAYRLAKFKTELAAHVEMDSTIFYYLFTELFLMVDSRAKNAFPSFIGGDKLCWLPYDFDTAIGINNEGSLVFDYGLEDIDTVSGADVYNGQQSVIWINLRQAFFNEIKTMYQTLRSSGALSYAVVENMFESHQEKWGEAIFNEDAYFKYLQPLLEDGSGAYLSMLQGSKAEQRKWWLYNRFRYIDSKYNAGDAQSDVIQLRGYAKANVTVTPYADVYASVKFGSYLQQTRAARNVPVTLVCPLDNVNDTEIYIYSASQLASVGDLSGLKVGYADFSMATKLQSLKLGDSDSNYENASVMTLALGNNTLLRTLDVRNCSGLASTVDISGCKNIENVYFDGTNTTGVTLPNGGILKVLHLPSTITNLTILNQTAITNLTIPSYSNISTLWLDNVSSAVNSKAILNAISAGSRVRLIGVQWEAANYAEIVALLDRLDTMSGMDEYGFNMAYAQISGTIHTSSLTGAQAAAIAERAGVTGTTYPYLTVTADSVAATVTFMSYDGASTIGTVTYLNGVAQSNAPSGPSRTSTAQYSYTFVGWSTAQDATSADSSATTNVWADRTVYAAYSRTVRTYTVTWKNSNGTVLETDTNVPYGSTPQYNGATPTYNGQTAQGWTPSISSVTGDVIYTATYIPTYTVSFYNGSTLLDTVTVQQGGTAAYTGTTPTKTGVEDPENYQFSGWSPSNTNIQANTSCYAQYNFIGIEDTITDSWAEIFANISNGTYATKYSIGDTKKLDLGTEGMVAMKIAAFDADDLASGNGKAPITWISEQLLATSHRMNPSRAQDPNDSSLYQEGTGAIGGWDKSEMRTYLKETVKPLIPSAVRSAIVEVTKTQPSYTTAGSSTTQTTTDDVWIPSYTEIFSSSGLYHTAFPDNASRVKKKAGAGSASWWWLRSAYGNGNFNGVSSDGSYSYSGAGDSGGIALGFCT